MKTQSFKNIVTASLIGGAMGLVACGEKPAEGTSSVTNDSAKIENVATPDLPDRNVQTIMSSVKPKTLPLIDFPISQEEMVPLKLSNLQNPERAFDLYVSDGHLVFKREDCMADNKPFYMTVQFYPTNSSDIKKAGGVLNNADHVPTYYQTAEECLSILPMPNYSLNKIYVGQTEKTLGRQWVGLVNTETLRAVGLN